MLLFMRCSPIAINTLIQESSVRQLVFRKAFPFENVNGKIIIKVQIQGQHYDFLFDTGAMCVLSNELAATLKPKQIGKQTFVDYSGKQQKLRFVQLDTVSVEGVDFLHVGAAVSDLSGLQKEGCVRVSGILGANLMSKAVWQIDYARKELVLCNHRDSLHFSPEVQKVSFSIGRQGTPKVQLYNEKNQSNELILDTGSGRNIDAPFKNAFLWATTDNEWFKSYGYFSGAFGNGLDTTLTTAIPNLTLGQHFKLAPSFISFKKKLSTGAIGYQFLKNYVVTLDWQYQDAYFEPLQPRAALPSLPYQYGFNAHLEGDALVVSYLYEGSPPHRAGLRLNDQILSINQTNYTTLTQERYCRILQDGLLPKGTIPLQLRVKRGAEELELPFF